MKLPSDKLSHERPLKHHDWLAIVVEIDEVIYSYNIVNSG